MVGGLSPSVEWHWDDVQCLSHVPAGSHYVGHIKLGLWGFYHSVAMVSVAMASTWKNVHITFKELVPVVMAVALWGGRWRGGTILCRSGNAAVVSIVNSGRSDKELAMHLVRTLSFYTAYYELVVVAEHVAGRQNEAVGAISRDCLTLFRHLIPQANLEPSSVPQGLLVTVRPDWTSNEWRRRFSASFRRDSPPRPSVYTYKSGQDHFLKFCATAESTPLPVDEASLWSFVAHLADQHLKHRTIKTYLSVVRHLQISRGLPDPFHNSPFPRLHYVLRGIKKEESESGASHRERLPITPDILCQIYDIWKKTGGSWDTKLLWAACCLAFFGFLMSWRVHSHYCNAV